MIIVISGRAGSGKSTIAKAIAKRLGLRHYSMGDLTREIAKERGLSLLELGKLEETDDSIDRAIDEKQRDLGKQDNFVIDGRLSAFFIPHANVKVFLDADKVERAKRILNDKRGGEKNEDVATTLKNMDRREESENKRYWKYYGFNCYDHSNYDLVLDTTKMPVEEVVDKIVAFVKSK
ncbi:cytidylate kinase family protein [Candidatus Woesearchaeota archaeon]|nr:cytidylate kinase family protein [Candidatus Woesearchaeota archaeon]